VQVMVCVGYQFEVISLSYLKSYQHDRNNSVIDSEAHNCVFD